MKIPSEAELRAKEIADTFREALLNQAFYVAAQTRSPIISSRHVSQAAIEMFGPKNHHHASVQLQTVIDRSRE